MSENAWRVLDGEGNEQGPYSFQDLQGFYTSGNITHETMIWTEGLDEWVPAGQVEGLLPDVPQVVQLAPAPVVAAAAPPQAAPAGGINLSPQVSGVALPGVPAQSAKNPAPTWLGILTIVIGLAALALFFFPWASISMDTKMMGGEGRVDAIYQTGVQTITKRVSTDGEFMKVPLKKLGIPDEEVDKMVDEMVEEMDNASVDDVPYESSVLVMCSLIGVGIGLIFALIGFVNQSKTLVLIAQILYVIGAILISIQMAQQFPAMEAFMDEQKKELESTLAQPMPTGDANETLSPAEEARKKDSQALAEKELANVFQTKFEPSCFATVGVLGVALLLFVIAMSSGGAPPVTIPQAGMAPQQPGAPQQPQQPGGGIRFQ